MSVFSEFIYKLRDPKIEQADKFKLIPDTCNREEWIKEVFKFTYDPFIQFYIKDVYPDLIDTTNINHSIVFDESTWKNTIIPFLDKLNKREYDRKTYLSILNNINSNMYLEDQEMLRCVITKDLRIGFAAKRINTALREDLIPVNNTQLCKTYDPSMNIKKVDGWWASRKLNGLRGKWESRYNEYRFLTREDYPLIGFDEIAKELDYLQKKYDLSLIDGEVFDINLPFQTIMSVARGTKTFDPEQKKLLKFNVFNIQRNSHKYKNTKEMIEFINNIFSNEKLEYIVPLEYVWVKNNADDIVNLCIKFTSEGYEGIVIRDPNVSWEGGKRNNHLLKYKLFLETDLQVKEILYGESGKKWENYITALYCEGNIMCQKVNVGNDILYRPISLNSGDDTDITDCVSIPVRVKATCSDWTDREREEFTKMDKNEIINRIGEIKFQSITDKPDANGYYSLQFPVFQKFKNIV